MIAQAVCFRFEIREIAVPARYFPEASSVNFRVSTKYGFKTLWIMMSVVLRRLGLLRPKIFQFTLPEVISRHYHDGIFGTKSDS